MRYPVCAAGLIGVVIACGAAPRTLHVQGEVRARGTLSPVPGAEVLIQWPRGGQTTVRTNAQGRYAVARALRAREYSCQGLAITVQARSYASNYLRQTEECADSVLNVNFTLFPIPQ